MSPLWLIYARSLIHALIIALIGISPWHGSVSPADLGNDFLVFWPVGHLVTTTDAARVYDPPWFSAWQSSHLMTDVRKHLQFFYPPPALLLTLIATPFSFMAGFLVWTAILTCTAIALLWRANVPWIVIFLGLLSTAGLYNMFVGQLGFLTGAMFISGLSFAETTPSTSGLILGALVLKPQAGLLAPVTLLARHQKQAIVTGVTTILLLCVVTTNICGWSIWPAFLFEGLKTSHQILVTPFPTVWECSGASVFWMIRSLGGSVGVAGVIQTISAAGAIAICFHAWRRPVTDRTALIALTVMLTLLVTPYGYTTDLCGVSIMVAWLAWERRKLQTADVLIWMWPALCPIIAISLHMELTPLILLVGAIRAYHRLDGIGTTAPACYPASV